MNLDQIRMQMKHYQLLNIPVGTIIHNISKAEEQALVKSAETVLNMAKEGNYLQVRLPSGEVRMVRINYRATIGEVGSLDHANIQVVRLVERDVG